jgi:hypothetical protein
MYKDKNLALSSHHAIRGKLSFNTAEKQIPKTKKKRKKKKKIKTHERSQIRIKAACIQS